MAVKQYENFKTPVIQSRFDRNNLANQRMNTYSNEQQLFARDPWFATGRLIGQTIADGYNDRGVAKGMDEMRGVLGQIGQQPQQAQQPQTPATQQLDPQNAVGVFDQMGNQMQGAFPNPAASIKDVMAQEKRDYFVNKYTNSDNPDSEALQNKNDIKAMDQAGNNLDFSQVNKEDVREQVRQRLQENGRTPYQIEQVLGQFDRMYDAKEAKWHQAKGTDYLQKGMNALNGENPDFNTAYMNLAAAAEHGNKQAGAWMQRLQYLQAQRDKIDLMNRQQQMQKDLIDYRTANGPRAGRPAGTSSPRATVNADGTVTTKRGSKNGKEANVESSLLERMKGYSTAIDNAYKELGNTEEGSPRYRAILTEIDSLTRQKNILTNQLGYYNEGAPFHDDYWQGSFQNTDGEEEE